MNYDEILDSLRENAGGVGPATTEAIREAFPEPEEFIDACEHTFQTGETEALERIDGIGPGYARGKLAYWAGEKYDWDGGDTRVVGQELTVKTADEVLADSPDDAVIVPNPVPEDAGTEDDR